MYLAKLYPTELRGAGQGFGYNVGRGMGAVGPAAIGVAAARVGLSDPLALAVSGWTTTATGTTVDAVGNTKMHRLVGRYKGGYTQWLKSGLRDRMRRRLHVDSFLFGSLLDGLDCTAQVERRVDERHVRERLRHVAELAREFRVVFLGQ